MELYKSGFSWRRVGMVVKYYYPTLRKQMIWYPAVAAGLCLIVSLLQLFGDTVANSSMGLLGAMSFMFYFAPVVLCRYESRLTTTLLPVTAAEKMVVLMVYFFVVIPLLLFGVEYAYAGLLHFTVPEMAFLDRAFAQYDALEIEIERKGLFMLSSAFLSILPTMLCLWGVTYYRQNRTLKALLTSCGVYLATSVAAGVGGMLLAFKRGFDDGVAGLAPAASEKAFVHEMTESMLAVFNVSGYVAMAASIVMAYLIYKEIKNFQI